jgi:hypothetical protein
MYSLSRLCEAIRAITPQAELRLHGKEGGLYTGSVQVAGVVLAEAEGDLDGVMAALTKRIESMSQRMMQAIKTGPAA